MTVETRNPISVGCNTCNSHESPRLLTFLTRSQRLGSLSSDLVLEPKPNKGRLFPCSLAGSIPLIAGTGTRPSCCRIRGHVAGRIHTNRAPLWTRQSRLKTSRPLPRAMACIHTSRAQGISQKKRRRKAVIRAGLLRIRLTENRDQQKENHLRCAISFILLMLIGLTG
jgi:hypothetical protein